MSDRSRARHVTASHHPHSERVLICAPHGRDAALAQVLLGGSDVPSVATADLRALEAELRDGAGVVVLTEEAVRDADLAGLRAWVAGQPPWSDLPFILLTPSRAGLDRAPVAARVADALGNVTVLEEPVRPATLLSVVRAALRGRRRQYDAGERLDELQVGGEHYRTLFDAIDAAFCTIEMKFDETGRAVDYRFIEVNPAFETQTGLVDATGRWMSDLVPTHEQHWFDTYGEVALTGVASRFENSAEALGRWYDVHAYRVDAPELRRVAILFNDISARRRAELALMASETELRLVADAFPVLVAFVDRSLTYRFANAASRDWFAREPDDVVGRTMPEVLGRTGFAERQAHAAAALRGERPIFELSWPWPDGRERIGEIRFTPRRDPEGAVDGFYIFVQDVTLQRQAATVLATRAATLELEVERRTRERDLIWQTSTDLLCVVDLDGRFVSLNPAWSATLGWSEDEIKAQPFPELVHPDDRDETRRRKDALARDEPVLGFENRYRHRDGKYRWLSWNAVPRDGLVYATVRDVTVARDQTDALAQAEEALRQSQKLEAIGQLTGGVAHDFNNLLTIIRSSVDFLRRRDISDERRRRYIDAVSDTVDRAAKLTGQLLAFARRQALKPEAFDVVQRLQGVVDMLDTITGARTAVVTDLPDAPCYARADLSQFETALVNMAVNARDAMNGEGTLTVRLTCGLPKPAIRGHGGSQSSFVAISLTDTGPGISPEVAERIFEPFFTTKEVGKGTGLGLSQVFGFAKQSGGDIDVRSRPGEGATFTLYLPEVELADAAPSVAPDSHKGEPAPGGAGRRVLVVEDNVEVGRFADQTLRDLGYETEWVANAEEALDRLGTTGNGFEVVFSDVVMPGMGGIALAETLRIRLPNLPVVLASGYSEVLAEEGTHGFELLQKPYSVEQLSRVLRQVTRTERRRVERVPS